MFSTKTIESSICDYSDAYILVTGNITVIRTITANATADPPTTKKEKQPLIAAAQVAFKNSKTVEQKLGIHLLIMQILLILQCLCTI